MNYLTNLIIGRNDLPSSKKVSIEFPLFGIDLQRRIMTETPLVTPIDEHGTITSPTNVYSIFPLDREVITSRLYLMTEKFNDLDVNGPIRVSFVSSTHVTSWTHLPAFDYPKFNAVHEMTDIATQTDLTGEDIVVNNSEPPFPDQDASNDDCSFDYLIRPVIMPNIVNAIAIAWRYPSSTTSLSHLWNDVRFKLRPPSDLEFTSFVLCDDQSSNLSTIVDAWLGLHRSEALLPLQSNRSHECLFSSCPLNWTMQIISLGYGNIWLPAASLIILLSIIKQFYLPLKEKATGYLMNDLKPIFKIPKAVIIIADFIEEELEQTNSDSAFILKVIDRFNLDSLRETRPTQMMTPRRYQQRGRLSMQRNAASEREAELDRVATMLVEAITQRK
jgi:hypothetical protein